MRNDTKKNQTEKGNKLRHSIAANVVDGFGQNLKDKVRTILFAC